uniref:Uncharacterized protein n=1 Tax=Escherichia coli TaxID=562 RepID=A0A7M3PR28_ECOLX|nr:Uncharacterised protein [Escherichia coli]
MLNDINKHDPVCIMTIVATTWGNSREVCTRNQALLKSALEGWGVCGTTTTFGDPRRAWVNTVLAASHTVPVQIPLYPPLSHALSLFPLNRAGSVWRGQGNLMMHTEDGSAWEVALASSQQNKHTEADARRTRSGQIGTHQRTVGDPDSLSPEEPAFHCLYRQGIQCTGTGTAYP